MAGRPVREHARRARAAPLQQGVDALTYAEFRGDRVYLQTNRDAPRWRLCVADPAEPAYENWRELIPEDPGAVLEDYVVLDGPRWRRPCCWSPRPGTRSAS
ncbi:hypothetical protein ACFQY4_32565 [Catellatospora bangladeshensis]|uniref:hypothetical protein n=1 Tax=Catellatospora bangladeshensis TaxID=310355 RepID=UPI003615782F